jgi:hypothetical protein
MSASVSGRPGPQPRPAARLRPAPYRDLTGWQPPAAGGPPSNQLTPDQRHTDQRARLQVSRELGHEREQTTAVYLGR